MRNLILLIFFLGSLEQSLVAAEGYKPNVLLIAIDDLNDWVSCLDGHPQVSTPNMDRLAARGVLFTNAHCQAPICCPSRTSFMSGLRPSTTGVYGNNAKYNAKAQLKPGKQVPWMTQRFEKSGYEVYTAGKILHGSKNQPLGGTTCFKTGQGPYPAQKLGVPKEITPYSIWDFGIFPSREEDYTDKRIADWTSKNIKNPYKQGDKPRFMALGFYNPHVPLFAPQKYYDAVPAAEKIELAPYLANDLQDAPEICKRISSRVSFSQCKDWCLETEENLRSLTRAYLACVTAMDDCLGSVIDTLDASDLSENTWIVVLSDHGWHLGEKDHVAKQTLWTRSTRVPLIIVPPKNLQQFSRGVSSDRPVELLDIYPTLVEAAGLAPVESDKQLDGLSLKPWLINPKQDKPRPAITTHYAHNHSICDSKFRYTRYADGTEELYDRIADPNEFDNLIKDVSNRENFNTLIEELSSWIPPNQAGEPDLVNDRMQN